MKVVLDINVLLISIPQKSKFRPIFNAIINGTFNIVISNNILSEYVEIIEQKTTPLIASNIAEMLLNLSNVQKVEIYFEWKLIQSDVDDNKYVDAYICSNSDYLVTNDQHFKILKQIDFPSVKLLSIDEFLSLIENDKK
ncbi:putative toxin-antitoxin system toxin component, PIN family [Pedobacter rhizosphaerae]|uniref:Putative toxin-antitoxin system toxin component, PIN family n=1 Tax=Pedobacter rhizosphaerae TaxID=390241 RepID=A0A1H9ULK5_9SPHI|nr:putative toxin-antitoxin system toxin component, PIN family [Pedobacter rhizosphaerae]SES10242.1 putative toxin-antitoxin system toxin component, PIN family [Pedobacter rhizosphaerae]